ncbi:MAG: PAS domain S-box protein, partial [Pseudomonadota bacterium]|nr:PAS domain S-box protein [Pseudomonadota bacterium]
MRLAGTLSGAEAWREFFDALSDAVVVLDNRACVVFANPAAMRLLPCAAGTPLRDLHSELGAAALRRLSRASGTQPDARAALPLVRLGDGRAASFVWCRLDMRFSALRLQPDPPDTAAAGDAHERAERSARIEEERDLAQLQIGALMDTAGVGLATYQQSSGWVRQRPQGAAAGSAEAGASSGASQSISRDIVVAASLAEYERLQVALRQDQRAEVRYEIEHAELGRRWLLTRVEPATLASGKRTTSVVTLDVTEQHRFQQRGEQLVRAERAASLQAERTRSILDSVLVGIVNVGPTGIEWMNRSARRMFGGSLADFIGSPLATVATPEVDHPFRRTRYLDDLVEGQAETFECRVRARDGREFWVVGNAVATDREPSGRQLTYALLDIERRREAEARMSEAQAALQQVIEAAPVAIALLDARTFKVVQVNVVAAAAIGATVEQLVGRTPEQIFP